MRVYACKLPYDGYIEVMISVVILTYNTRAITLKCLESLYKSEGVEFETIAVDNASRDGSTEAVG